MQRQDIAVVVRLIRRLRVLARNDWISHLIIALFFELPKALLHVIVE